MYLNLVDQIGSSVTVWTKDGDAKENRTLHTLDEYGVVVDSCSNANEAVFVPWCRITSINYPKNREFKCRTQTIYGLGDGIEPIFVPESGLKTP